jgi:hypothetical protein
MRKLLQMEERIGKEEWPTDEIRTATQNLYEYLSTYNPEGRSSFSKNSIMGPVGKLLSMVSSEAGRASRHTLGQSPTSIISRRNGSQPPTVRPRSEKLWKN